MAVNSHIHALQVLPVVLLTTFVCIIAHKGFILSAYLLVAAVLFLVIPYRVVFFLGDFKYRKTFTHSAYVVLLLPIVVVASPLPPPATVAAALFPVSAAVYIFARNTLQLNDLACCIIQLALLPLLAAVPAPFGSLSTMAQNAGILAAYYGITVSLLSAFPGVFNLGEALLCASLLGFGVHQSAIIGPSTLAPTAIIATVIVSVVFSLVPVRGMTRIAVCAAAWGVSVALMLPSVPRFSPAALACTAYMAVVMVAGVHAIYRLPLSNTHARKAFHALYALIVAPVIVVAPDFAAYAITAALNVFLFIAMAHPAISVPGLARFADAKDAVAPVSPVFLLAAPLAPLLTGFGPVASCSAAMAVWVGDSLAAIVGSRGRRLAVAPAPVSVLTDPASPVSRRRQPTGKHWEGVWAMTGGLAAVWVALALPLARGLTIDRAVLFIMANIIGAAVCALGELVTDANDNLTLPLAGVATIAVISHTVPL
ncbi:hypothetical protein J8273_7958 [Carpediemonas membranifera]|uniref:dolichol kinase n=1 Tax=Carpediemonas membranifera TaxID=201153 RepID=A0A8J6E1G6_9EUKA|nr:hypothetical protein J8273_7958 [Carpediemonas membranifera]|eukprot:KAG9390607.1 hypothetical protein J8273_7958 [Carpediemonas membranifera]